MPPPEIAIFIFIENLSLFKNDIASSGYIFLLISKLSKASINHEGELCHFKGQNVTKYAGIIKVSNNPDNL